MITPEEAYAAAIRLQCLKFFPPDPEGAVKTELARLFHRMAATSQQLDWLVSTMIDRVGTYPGTEQIRAVFCTRFKPLDGIEANVSAELPIYQTGEQCEAVEKTKAFIEPSTLRQIAGTVEREPDTDLAGRLLSVGVDPESKSIPPLPKPAGSITQDDIDHARAQHQLKRLGEAK